MLNAVSQEPFISRDAQHRDVTNDYQSVKRDHYLTSEKNRGVYDQNWSRHRCVDSDEQTSWFGRRLWILTIKLQLIEVSSISLQESR